MSVLCAARTARGFGCINASKDGAFCPGHDPRNWCNAPTTTGRNCRRMKSYGTQFCSKHQN